MTTPVLTLVFNLLVTAALTGVCFAALEAYKTVTNNRKTPKV